jgi:hypothetical protein
MAGLESEIRRAFGRRLAALPPSPDLGRRLSAAAEMRRPRPRARQAAALTVGLLLVGAVTFSVILTRHAQHGPGLTIGASATPTPTPSPSSSPPAAPTPIVHATGSAEFAGCQMTSRKDSYGNPLWYCPLAPHGYHYWEPPADCCGDWTAVEP